MTAHGVVQRSVLALCGLAAVFVWAGVGGPAAAITGVALVCLLPGLAAVTLIDLHVGALQTLALACAASLALDVLVGLALGASHLGFGARAWTTTLAGVAGALAAAGLIVSRPSAGIVVRLPRLTALRSRAAELLLYSLAASIAAVAVGVAHRDAISHLRSVAVAPLPIAATRAHPPQTVKADTRRVRPGRAVAARRRGVRRLHRRAVNRHGRRR